ncbi:MAG: hypothetical protein IJU99_07570 [Lachnospiraceae bacterium]|nr:hypothetical protein [Lachnospiraceae bacterium]
MISVLLTILKIIGIILLVILGLVLLILLIVLFVPFRYRINAEGEDKRWEGDAAFGWLAWLVSVRAGFHEKKLKILAKVFGFTVYDSEKKKAAQKKEEPAGDEKTEEDVTAEDTADEKPEESSGEEETPAESPPAEETSEAPEEPAADEEETDEEEVCIGSEPVEEDADIFSDITEPEATPEAEESPEEKKVIESIWNRIDRIWEKIDTIRDKAEPVLEFIQEDDTKDLIGSTFKRLGRLIRHVLPYSLSGWLLVGTGDPVNTAKLAAVMSYLYPKLPKDFSFEPYFIDKKAAADLTLKGRIRIGTMAGILIGLVLKGYTIRTIKRVKALMSTLKEKPQEE